MQIWAALLVAALCGSALVGLVSGLERLVLRRGGAR